MPTPSHVTRVTEVFDRWAEAGKAEGMERSHGPAARRAFDMLGLEELPGPFRYLDVGCGNGYTVRWAAALLAHGRADSTPAHSRSSAGASPRAAHQDALPHDGLQSRPPPAGVEGGLAVGLDGSERMVQRARARAENAHQRFVHAQFPDHGLPELLAPASFDAVFSMEVFYYLPSLEAGLAEVARLLKPGGRFACVVDHYAENPASHGWPAMLGVEMDLRTQAQWRAAFAEAGLEVVHQGRLRAAPGSTDESWKVEQGSLVTVGRRPA